MTKKDLICGFCGEDYLVSEVFQLDKDEKGFWCELCDYYTYFNNRNHHFKLVLEENANTSSKFLRTDIKFNKYLSPLRYPDGKT